MHTYLDIIQSVSLSNKYTKWYMDIINAALNRNNNNKYTERHHILPKCFNMGGKTDINNIVRLTGKEHFICHLLLVKMVSDKQLKLKLACASLKMCFTNGVDRYKVSSSTYELIKTTLSKNKTGTSGITWTDEQRAKLKNRIPHNKGQPMSESQKQKLRDARAKQHIGPRSDGTKQKLKTAFLGKPRPDNVKSKIVVHLKSHKGTYWWNNGLQNKRSIQSPGIEWISGRLKP